MKLIELLEYRAFMFTTVPMLLKPNGNVTDAIGEACKLWILIDRHVLEVAAELEKEPE